MVRGTPCCCAWALYVHKTVYMWCTVTWRNALDTRYREQSKSSDLHDNLLLLPCFSESSKLKRQREASPNAALEQGVWPAVKRSSVETAAATQSPLSVVEGGSGLEAISTSMASAELRAQIQKQIESSHVLVYCKTTCPFCTRVRHCFSSTADENYSCWCLVAPGVMDPWCPLTARWSLYECRSCLQSNVL